MIWKINKRHNLQIEGCCSKKGFRNIVDGGKGPLLLGTSDSRQGCPPWVAGHNAQDGFVFFVFVFHDG